jgi:hypothetical protein
MLATSKNVNDAARKVLHHKFRNRALITIDGKKLIEYIAKTVL